MKDHFEPGDIIFLDTGWSLGQKPEAGYSKPLDDMSGVWLIGESGPPTYLKVLTSQLLSLSDEEFNELITRVSSQRLGLDDDTTAAE